MSDSQYWASLKGAGIFLYLCLFGLFLGVMILAVIYDRVSTFPIWDSPLWLKLKTPIIILVVIGFLVALIAYIRSEGLKELQAAQEYAQAQGWGFSSEDTQGLKPKVAEILQDLKFDLHSVRTVETGKRNLYVFDCSYKHREESASAHNSRGTACFIQSDKFHAASAPVEMALRDWTEIMASDKVDMDVSPFSEAWLVLSKDGALARQIVNESIQSILLEHLKKPMHSSVSVIVGPGGAIVLAGRTSEQDGLQDLIALARRIESAME